MRRELMRLDSGWLLLIAAVASVLVLWLQVSHLGFSHSPSNPLMWIALGPDYEIHSDRVPTYPCFILYILSKLDLTNDIHLSRLST